MERGKEGSLEFSRTTSVTLSVKTGIHSDKSSKAVKQGTNRELIHQRHNLLNIDINVRTYTTK